MARLRGISAINEAAPSAFTLTLGGSTNVLSYQQVPTIAPIITGGISPTYSWSLTDPAESDRSVLWSGSTTASSPGNFTPDRPGVWTETVAVTDNSITQYATRRVQVGDDNGWMYFNPLLSTKSDPNSIEVAVPVADLGALYTVTFNASTIRANTGDMLLYHYVVPVITWADRWWLEVELNMKNESNVNLIGGVTLTDNPASIVTSNGIWMGACEETSNNIDYWIRYNTETTPNTTSVVASDAKLRAVFQHEPSSATYVPKGVVLDGSTIRVIGMSGFGDKSEGSPATSGNVTIGMLIGCRTAKNISENFKIGIKYRVSKWPE
jgi:hypothetical protein